MSPETKEWLLARGAKEDRKQGYLLIPHTCKQLIEHVGGPCGIGPDETFSEASDPASKGKTMCALHGTDRYPLACARYHGFGHFYKPEGCGYLKKD